MDGDLELAVTVCEEGISLSVPTKDDVIREADELDALKGLTGEALDRELDRTRRFLGDTALHLTVRFRKIAVMEHLVRERPHLVKEVNDDQENSLHLVARLGNERMAHLLMTDRKMTRRPSERIQVGVAAKEALRAQNRYGDTPAHEAVRTRNFGVAKALVRADPTLAELLNGNTESLLYLAAERDMQDLAWWLLYYCKTENITPSFDGAKGETALHAAVKSWKGREIRMLLDHNYVSPEKKLALQPNEHGDVPLHYAAYMGKQRMMVLLLEHDHSCGYVQNKDGNCAIHMAAIGGHMGAVDLLSAYCPSSGNLVNNKGRNALHVAIQYERRFVVRHILWQPKLEGLVCQRDCEGNNALHLAARYWNVGILRSVLGDKRLDSMARNCSHQTALDIFRQQRSDQSLQWAEAHRMLTTAIPCLELDTAQEEDNRLIQRKEAKARLMSKVDEGRKSALQLAALISAVTFAAAFTVPGGYNSGPPEVAGLPVLLRRLAFKVFVVSDTATMCCSLAVLFLCGYATWEDVDYVISYWFTILGLMWAAFVGMTVSFATGMYTILHPGAPVLATVTNFICYGIPGFTLLYARWPVVEMCVRLLIDGIRRMRRRGRGYDLYESLAELKVTCFPVSKDESLK